MQLEPRAFIILINTLLIAIPAFLANFSLSSVTYIEGFEESSESHSIGSGQIAWAITCGLVAALGEAFTETVSACDEVSEEVSNFIASLPRLM